MLKVSTKIRYALRVLVNMVKSGDKITSAQLAEKSGVSPYYLRQILFKLEKQGIIKGTRGGKGGYTLAVKPGNIKISQIFQFFGESIQLVDCLAPKPKCKFYKSCNIRPFWEKLKNIITKELEKTTLEDLIKGRNSGNGA